MLNESILTTAWMPCVGRRKVRWLTAGRLLRPHIWPLRSDPTEAGLRCGFHEASTRLGGWLAATFRARPALGKHHGTRPSFCVLLYERSTARQKSVPDA